MKLSISTFKIICYFWNYPQEVLEDKEYLIRTLGLLERDINFTELEIEIAKEELSELLNNLL